MNEQARILRAHLVRFYSRLDEQNFFAWLEQISAVEKVYGVGENIVIECRSAPIPDDQLRELIALFFRYKVDTKQLDAFVTDENRSWFTDENSFWRR